MTAISALTALTGAGVDQAADLIPIVDMSLAGSARNKKILVGELLSSTVIGEVVRDTIGSALVAGTGVTVTVDDGADTITVASSITQYTDEMARDALGTALVAGSGITITPNDGADTITITSSGGVAALDDVGDVNAPTPSNGDVLTWDSTPGEWVSQAPVAGYTDEQAQDAVGTILVDSSTIDLTYTDATPAITAALKLDGAKVRKSVTLTGQDVRGAGAAIVFNTEDWDTNGYHDTGSNTDRLTVPAAGYYRVSGNIDLANVVSGSFCIGVIRRYNSSNVQQETIATLCTELSFTGGVYINLSGTGNFASGDFARLWVLTESDTSVDITTDTWFEIARVG